MNTQIELQNDDAVFLDLFWLAQPEDRNAPSKKRLGKDTRYRKARKENKAPG